MFRMIVGMSRYQKAIQNDLISASKPIDIHIAKLLLFPGVQTTHHWQHEIYTALNDIDYQKGSNKWPKASFIEKSLAMRNDMLSIYVQHAKRDEKDLEPRYVSLDVVTQIVKKYQNWIAQVLSEYGYVEEDIVYHKLDELIKSTL